MSDLVRGEPGSVYSEKIVVNGEEVRKALRKVNSNNLPVQIMLHLRF